MHGQAQSARKSGQHEARLRDLRIGLGMPKVVQLSFEVNFKPAEKTTANGSDRHDRPPGWQVAHQYGFIYFSASWMFCRWGHGRQRHSGEINSLRKIRRSSRIAGKR